MHVDNQIEDQINSTLQDVSEERYEELRSWIPTRFSCEEPELMGSTMVINTFTGPIKDHIESNIQSQLKVAYPPSNGHMIARDTNLAIGPNKIRPDVGLWLVRPLPAQLAHPEANHAPAPDLWIEVAYLDSANMDEALMKIRDHVLPLGKAVLLLAVPDSLDPATRQQLQVPLAVNFATPPVPTGDLAQTLGAPLNNPSHRPMVLYSRI